MTKLFLMTEVSFTDLLLRAINWNVVLIALGIMGGLAVLLGLLILLVSKVFAVKTDGRVNEIAALLPGANCGGCGYAGCQALAEAIVAGKADIDSCGVSSRARKAEIAGIMGMSFTGGEETVAVVACAGGNKCKDRYIYQGYGDCRSQDIMAGGRKQCSVGCIGSATCVDACSHFAIEVKEGVAEIDPAQCISCGACIRACPKNIIKRVPKSAKVYVACSSTCKGRDVTLMCEAGCISCGSCVRNCPETAIVMQNNIPVIDYRKCTGCGICMEKCPRKVIREMK